MLKRVEKVMAAVSRLPDLEDSQFETTLLRSCLALPKVAFSLRCCPPSHIKDAISVFDDVMRDTLGAITGGSIPDWAWLKASLPSSRGGLNIRRASLHSPAAYISSLKQCKGLVARIMGGVLEPSRHLTSSTVYVVLQCNQRMEELMYLDKGSESGVSMATANLC